MSFKKICQIFACVLIVIGIIVSLYSAWQRFDIERSNKKTSLLLDYNQLLDVCALEDISLKDALLKFAPYATGLVIKEPTLSDLENNNQIVVKSGIEIQTQSDEWLENKNINRKEIKNNYYYLFFNSSEDMSRVEKHIKAKVPQVYCNIESEENKILVTSLPSGVFSSLGVGFSNSDLNTIEEAGLKTVVQIRDSKYPFTMQAIDAEISDLKNHDILAIGFNDTSVSGANLKASDWGELKKYWVNSFHALNAPLINIEFYSQKGLSSLSRDMGQDILRMHAISEQEMLNSLTQEKAVERLQLAASERNMKLLLVRFLPYSDIDQNVDYFINISKALWQKGIVVTPVSATIPLVPNSILLFLIALAVLSGTWLLASWFKVPIWLDSLGFIFAAIFAIALLYTSRVELMQRSFAFLSVLVFPTLAVVRFTPERSLNIFKSILNLIQVSAISLIGALLMVGLFADGSFMLKLVSFSGVKAAHLFPIILIFIWFFFIREKDEPSLVKINNLMEKPLTIKYLIVAGFIGAILVLYVMRTGNESVSVSEWERTFRTLLDNLLLVRPRTKEFMLGYPLLLFSFYYGYSKKVLPVLLLGSIGLISSVNTFAHIHTPLLISVLRTFNGLVLGIVAGVVLIMLSQVCLKIWNKAGINNK